MDRALILHIGHHRTGTTTLQKLVFPQLTSVAYFCKDSTQAFLQIVRAFGRSPAIWRQRGSEIFHQLVAEVSARKVNGGTLISAEGMSAHRIFAAPGVPHKKKLVNHRRDPFLLAAHLRECRTVAEKAGFDSVKVIMGIRRQDQYLASRYAKMARILTEPSQADFVEQVLEIIDPEKRYFLDGVWLDYKMTRDLIAEAVGENNVLVLPVELLGSEPSGYLAALSAFVGEPLNSPALESLNTHRIAPEVWQIEQDSMRRAARKKRLGRLRAPLAQRVEIRLSPELKEKILATYRDCNESLAATLNLDLGRYGYCGPQSHNLDLVNRP